MKASSHSLTFVLLFLSVAAGTEEKVKVKSQDVPFLDEIASSLPPSNHKKRSISTLINLLVGGNVPPSHPLVKESESKIWSGGNDDALGLGTGWSPSTAEQIQTIFNTKAKLLPYTGQVYSGLSGIASVNREILKQVRPLIARAAARTAARAATRAAAAHGLTHQYGGLLPPALQTVTKAIQTTTALKADLANTRAVNALAKAQAHAYLQHTLPHQEPALHPHDHVLPHPHAHAPSALDYNQGWGSSVQQAYAVAGPPYPAASGVHNSESPVAAQGYHAAATAASAAASTNYNSAAASTPGQPFYGAGAAAQLPHYVGGRASTDGGEGVVVGDAPSILSSLATILSSFATAPPSAYNTLKALASVATAEQQQQQQQSLNEAGPSLIHTPGYPVGAQYGAHHASKYSPEVGRNTPNPGAYESSLRTVGAAGTIGGYSAAAAAAAAAAVSHSHSGGAPYPVRPRAYPGGSSHELLGRQHPQQQPPQHSEASSSAPRNPFSSSRNEPQPQSFHQQQHLPKNPGLGGQAEDVFGEFASAGEYGGHTQYPEPEVSSSSPKYNNPRGSRRAYLNQLPSIYSQYSTIPNEGGGTTSHANVHPNANAHPNANVPMDNARLSSLAELHAKMQAIPQASRRNDASVVEDKEAAAVRVALKQSPPQSRQPQQPKPTSTSPPPPPPTPPPPPSPEEEEDGPVSFTLTIPVRGPAKVMQTFKNKVDSISLQKRMWGAEEQEEVAAQEEDGGDDLSPLMASEEYILQRSSNSHPHRPHTIQYPGGRRLLPPLGGGGRASTQLLNKYMTKGN